MMIQLGGELPQTVRRICSCGESGLDFKDSQRTMEKKSTGTNAKETRVESRIDHATKVILVSGCSGRGLGARGSTSYPGKPIAELDASGITPTTRLPLSTAPKGFGFVHCVHSPPEQDMSIGPAAASGLPRMSIPPMGFMAQSCMWNCDICSLSSAVGDASYPCAC
jgi:hypothetical protein